MVVLTAAVAVVAADSAAVAVAVAERLDSAAAALVAAGYVDVAFELVVELAFERQLRLVDLVPLVFGIADSFVDGQLAGLAW